MYSNFFTFQLLLWKYSFVDGNDVDVDEVINDRVYRFSSKMIMIN